MRRVVVTGMGAITPIGLGIEEYWNGIREGKTGFGEITYFDTTDYKVKVAAEVKGFKAADYMDKKTARRMESFSQYAVAAAKEAMEMSGIDMGQEDPYRVGICVGSGVGSGISETRPQAVPSMMTAGRIILSIGDSFIVLP